MLSGCEVSYVVFFFSLSCKENPTLFLEFDTGGTHVERVSVRLAHHQHGILVSCSALRELVSEQRLQIGRRSHYNERDLEGSV